MEHSNFLHFNRHNELARNRVQDQMSTQYRINRLREDPAAAAQSMRFQSKATRLERYSHNIDNTINYFSVVEGNMAQATEILQRIRELTVQGANGTYTQEETRYMAMEVNQLLEELLMVGNSRDGNGLALFAGTHTNGEAFRGVRTNVAGSPIPLLSNVEYLGNSDSRLMQYGDGFTIETQFSGNRVFWAENQRLMGANSVAGFVVQQDSSIIINGQEVNLNAGDSIHTVINRINNSETAVRASLDPVFNRLVLTTTEPHQLSLSDGVGSVFNDLGIIDGPNNFADGVISYGGSMFDMIIAARDAMLNGDQEALSGRILGGLDLAFTNLNNVRADLGSRENRLAMANNRLGHETLSYIRWDNSLRGLNFAEAATELSHINTVLQATYSMASNILQPTLMDFLR